MIQFLKDHHLEIIVGTIMLIGVCGICYGIGYYSGVASTTVVMAANRVNENVQNSLPCIMVDKSIQTGIPSVMSDNGTQVVITGLTAEDLNLINT
jgi:hypothetical protein